ncbi:mucin-3B-like [Pseudorasbora parva]|uniref:mucin-3B-like n=1 Tax=Pseudorasbora parva TaxID=51549 RepID=UPI00351E2A8E
MKLWMILSKSWEQLGVSLSQFPPNRMMSRIEKRENKSTLPIEDEVALSKKPSQSEEYIKRHVEDISVEEVECNISTACVQESSDVSKDIDVNQSNSFTELSTEEVQGLSQTISSLPQQLESGITENITTSTLIQMSLDSVTEQPHILSLPITDSGPSEARVEITIPITLTKQTEAKVTETKYTTSSLVEVVTYRPLSPVSLTSQVELRSLSPEFEYVDNLEMISSEYRSSSPESVVSLPLDSPILFDYRPSSPDSCILMAELRLSSPESVTSLNDCTLLSVDSPLPDFRPATPLPTVFENDTHELAIYVEEYKTLSPHAEKMAPLARFTEDAPSYLLVTEDTERPISPGSAMFYRSLSPESNRSWSPVSISSEISDRESSTEMHFESYTPSQFLTEFRPSSPESTASVNEYRLLPPDSPIPCFATEVQNDFSALMAEYRSPSFHSEVSDIDSDLISLECLVGSRPSSPESTASLNNQRCLSPDSPLPSFTQTVFQCFIPTKMYRSDSDESGLSDNENKAISEVLPETRLSSPESLTSINEHRPLSPDSPVPMYITTMHFNVIPFGSHRDSSPELETSDIEYSQCDSLLCEPRSESPESFILEPEDVPLSMVSVESVTFEGEPIEETCSQNILAVEPIETLYNEEQSMSELPKPKYTFMSKAMLSNRIAKIFDPHYKSKTFYSNLVALKYTGDVSEKAKSITLATGKAEVLHGPQEIHLSPKESIVHNYFKQNPSVECTVNKQDLPQIQLDFESPAMFQCERKPLSSESHDEFRSISPESLVLDDAIEGILCRPLSPESIASVNEFRPLSPDSPVTELSGFFSTEITFPVTGHRSCSPQSLCSENTEYEPCLEELLTLENRPDSPDSILSDIDKRPFSPDSLPEWRPMSPEYALLLEDIRGSSPQSDGSMNECRPLSPDSPTPQYFPAIFESISVTDCRSSSPESALSEEEWELNVFTQYLSLESTESLKEEGSDSRSLSPDSPVYQYYAYQFEPAIVTGYISQSPESTLSELDMQTEAFDDLVTDLKRSSPESIISDNENRPLSPDSPIPDFTPATDTLFMPLTGSRPTSPESDSLDLENELCQSDLDLEQRSDSPQSISSETEIRPLSPDSPVPQFSPLFSQSTLPVTGSRSCSPQLLRSENTEYEPCLEELLTLENRPDSPDSFLSNTDKRSLSPDSLPEWRPMSPEYALLLEDIRGSSPQSDGSMNECRPLSPDSPTPQYLPAVFESIPVQDYRSSSPESALSEEEWELNVFTQDFSLESTESLKEEGSDSRSLSPDSPIYQYYAYQFEPTIVTGYISQSPESTLSELDMQTDAFDDLVIELRRPSPESITSDNENRPLSPDSPIPDFTPATDTLFMPLTGSRPTSPESDSLDLENELCQSDLDLEQRSDSPQSISSETEIRPLSPDSPVPQFSPLFSQSTLPVTGSRSCSPQSLCSENTEYEPCLEELLTLENRPDSTDSILSDTDKRSLSPDSLPEWRPMSSEYALLLEEIRGSSPQSDGSMNECRPLSPDSPTPQYFPAVFESIPVQDYRSSSPESTLSEEEWELNVFTQDFSLEPTEYLKEEGSDSRSLSPDSPIYQYYAYQFEPAIVTGYISQSPESTLSELDMQTEIFDDLVTDLRRSSPESVTSDNENRPLSPDSPIPDFTPATDTLFMPLTGSRPTSPESESLDLENELCQSDLDLEQRSDSPQSISSETEIRPLSPDSPVPQFSPLFSHSTLPVTGSRSCSPQSLCSENTEYEPCLEELLTLENRPDSPDSFLSDTDKRSLSPDSLPEWRPMSTEYALLLEDIRGSSPQSDGSINECRPLSPDSPTPQFFPADFESIPVPDYRSSSPESALSEEEWELNVFTQYFSLESTESLKEEGSDSRSLSPDSPVYQYYNYQFEPTMVTGYISQSPESMLSELDMQTDAFDDLVIELRRSSPESITSDNENRPLSPDSPIPDFTPATHRFIRIFTGSRPTSPESDASDLENELCQSDLNQEQRSDSPQSISSETEIRPLSPDSPVPQFSALFTQSTLPVTGSRSCSPQSLCSENTEYESYLEDLFTRGPMPSELDISTAVFNDSLTDLRLSSPDSMTSVNESRPLSPDSPVPDFMPLTFTFIIPESDSQSTSPVSLDIENEFYQYDLGTEQRPDSPESVISEIEHRPLSPDSVSDYRPISPISMVDRASPESFISLEECRPLSPDSPVPQFSCIHKISAMNLCRSESSESLSSDTDIELWVFAPQTTEQRTSSPESIMSLNDKRPLSPDSPVYDFTPLVYVTPKATYRSSSLESIASDVEFKMASFASEGNAWTEIRASSPESGKISPVDQHHLEIEHNQTVVQSQQSLGQEVSTYLSLQMPQYKLVYKAVPLSLISHLYDPQYRGESFCAKPGVFEYAGCKKEIFKTFPNNECTQQRSSETYSSSLNTSYLQLQVQEESLDLFGSNQAFSTDSLFYYTSSDPCLMDNSDRRASSPESYTSINEYRQLSPDSPVPEHRPSLPSGEFLVESRPSSPETTFSLNEFRSLSPDSPIPEFSTPSPVPNESSVVLMQHKLIFTPLSPSLCNDMESTYSSWYPLPQWIMSENRPLSSISDISDTDSGSLSPQMFCHETELRNPSPEAATLETELTETVTPEPFVFEIFQSESPESVIESESEFYENLNYFSFSGIDEIETDISDLKDDSALLNLVTFEQCTAQIKSPPETERLQTVECSFDEGLKPNPSHDIALEQAQKDTESVTKTITYCEERDVISAEGASAKDETREVLVIHKRDDNQHIESSQQQKDDLGHDSRKVATQDAKKRDNVSMDIHLEPQLKDLSLRKEDAFSVSRSLEPQIKSTASLLTSESSFLATRVPEIPQQNRSQPVFELKAHKSTSDSPHEEPRGSNELQEVNYFQFHLKDSHRRVELNRIDSSAFSLSLESPDYKNLLSRSMKTQSTGIQVSRTDLSSISPMFSTSSSDQGISAESHQSLSKRIPCAAEVVPLSHDVSKFEQTLPSFGGDEPESNLSLPGTYLRELKASEMAAKQTGDQMQFDATDSPLYSLKSRPRPVHADSIESDPEFFDCQQTFSDTSEPEVGSLELLDVPQAIYQLEELPSLSSSPEYLTVVPKLREYTQLKKDDRPLSWGSEDLPIVLEPEDEYTGEEKAFPYDYTGDHSFAEELPPMESVQYDDDDDDFLGRVSLFSMASFSEEECCNSLACANKLTEALVEHFKSSMPASSCLVFINP